MEVATLVLEYIKVLIWPFTVIVILITFRKEVSKLFDRAKKLDLPGGISLEVFEEKIQEAKQIAKEVAVEVRSELEVQKKLKEPKSIITEAEMNKKMIELGLKPSPSGLKISYYQEIASKDPRLALAGLRIDLELMLKNLLIGFKINLESRASIRQISNALLENGAISQKQYALINKLLQIANAAVHGIEVTEEQANEVFDIMRILVEDYKAWLTWGFIR